MKSSGPLVIAVVLLLCVPVYLVSYFGLVVPGGVEVRSSALSFPPPPVQYAHYRFADNQAAVLYWPLEQMDRRIRPDAWDADVWVDVGGPGLVSGFSTNCTFGADEMTTEASFFEEPEESADPPEANPFDDAP